jgi:hypothetical protein
LPRNWPSVALSAPKNAAAGERMVDLFRRGYQLVVTEPDRSFVDDQK